MKDMRAVERYAEALFRLTQERDEVKQVSRDLEWIAGLFGNHPQLVRFLTSPSVGRAERKGWVRKNLAGEVSPVTVRFLEVLIAKGRGDLFGDVRDAFEQRARGQGRGRGTGDQHEVAQKRPPGEA